MVENTLVGKLMGLIQSRYQYSGENFTNGLYFSPTIRVIKSRYEMGV